MIALPLYLIEKKEVKENEMYMKPCTPIQNKTQTIFLLFIFKFI